MANQPQPRPWFRLASLARPMQPPVPQPAPASRPQMQPPAALLPRPTTTFRPPVAPLPQPGQDTQPPLQPSIPPSLPPSAPLSSASSASVPPALPPAPVTVSPLSPPKLLPRNVTQKSPFSSPSTQNSPLASPVSQKSPFASPSTQKSPLAVTQESLSASAATQKSSPYASPTTQKSPPPLSHIAQKSSPHPSPVTQKHSSEPRASPVSSTIPSPSPSPSPKPKTLSPPPSFPSPAMKLSSPSPPPKPASPYANQISSPALTSSLKPSNGLVSSTNNPPVSSRLLTPRPSPSADKPHPETPPESPKIKSAIHSPPLFSLPPSQWRSDGEYERKIPAISEKKTVLNVQDSLGKPRSFLKPYGNSDDLGMRAITISGENRGAIMDISYSPGKNGNPRKLRSDGELYDRKSNGNERRSERQGKNHNARAKHATPTPAFMNSNVQGINSSIVLNSTLSHHDPGVHLSFTRKPVKGHPKEHSNGHNVFQKEGGYRLSD